MRLKADNIKFGYTGNHRVLNHVDFTVEEGEVTGLIAPSGYGKTTLAKILAGYIKPEQGTVYLEERDDEGNYVRLDLPKGYNPVQLIFQHPEKAVNPKWKMKKVLEEIGMPTKVMLDAAGIKEEWLNRWPAELSGGELQRFCVVRTLNPHARTLGTTINETV